MKRLRLAAVSLLLAAIFAAIFPTEKDAEIYEDTVRLHILAASDSATDQQLKYEIRDELLKNYGERLSDCKTAEEAESTAEGLLGEIEESVNGWIAERGFDYTATVSLGKEWYDTRKYADYTMPSGIYTSLCVVIDEGRGQNWWCVMYPPLCTELATENAPRDDGLIDYTKEEIRLISSGEYNVKFKTLEIISSTFRKK